MHEHFTGKAYSVHVLVPIFLTKAQASGQLYTNQVTIQNFCLGAQCKKTVSQQAARVLLPAPDMPVSQMVKPLSRELGISP